MSDVRLAPLDVEHADNRGVLSFLAARNAGQPPIARPSSVPDPYQECGSHPEIVEQVWDGLGKDLPRASKALVYGCPALVHPETGLVLALALGTEYALRVPAARLAEAEKLGLESSHRYRTAGMTLDLASFGSGWRFGGWHAAEREWMREA